MTPAAPVLRHSKASRRHRAMQRTECQRPHGGRVRARLVLLLLCKPLTLLKHLLRPGCECHHRHGEHEHAHAHAHAHARTRTRTHTTLPATVPHTHTHCGLARASVCGARRGAAGGGRTQGDERMRPDATVDSFYVMGDGPTAFGRAWSWTAASSSHAPCPASAAAVAGGGLRCDAMHARGAELSEVGDHDALPGACCAHDTYTAVSASWNLWVGEGRGARAPFSRALSTKLLRSASCNR